MYEIEISSKKGFKDSRGEHTLSDISGIGINAVQEAKYSQLYFIDGNISASDAKLIAGELLSDKITESYAVRSFSNPVSGEPISLSSPSIVEVWFKKGVTDTVAESVVKAVADLGIKAPVKVRTGHKYYLSGKLSKNVLETIASKLLANTMIQEYKIK